VREVYRPRTSVPRGLAGEQPRHPVPELVVAVLSDGAAQRFPCAPDANVVVTGVYAHVLPGSQREAADLFARVVGKAA